MPVRLAPQRFASMLQRVARVRACRLLEGPRPTMDAFALLCSMQSLSHAGVAQASRIPACVVAARSHCVTAPGMCLNHALPRAAWT